MGLKGSEMKRKEKEGLVPALAWHLNIKTIPIRCHTTKNALFVALLLPRRQPGSLGPFMPTCTGPSFLKPLQSFSKRDHLVLTYTHSTLSNTNVINGHNCSRRLIPSRRLSHWVPCL